MTVFEFTVFSKTCFKPVMFISQGMGGLFDFMKITGLEVEKQALQAFSYCVTSFPYT